MKRICPDMFGLIVFPSPARHRVAPSGDSTGELHPNPLLLCRYGSPQAGYIRERRHRIPVESAVAVLKMLWETMVAGVFTEKLSGQVPLNGDNGVFRQKGSILKHMLMMMKLMEVRSLGFPPAWFWKQNWINISGYIW